LDGLTETLATNILAENVLSQVGENGHRQKIIDEIMDHCVLEDVIPKSKGTYHTFTGMTRMMAGIPKPKDGFGCGCTSRM
jgi:hypothetical protein